MDCRKCMYFEKKKGMFHSGKVIVGFCKLRNKHISDMTMQKEQCKDKAVVDIANMEAAEAVKKSDPDEESVIRKAAWG